MTRTWLKRAWLTLALLVVLPAPAAADLTAFWGFSPSPASRSTRGFGVGVNILLLGFEFEYGNTSENADKAAPSLKTYMFDGLVLTPTSGVQLYLAGGGGFFRERLGTTTETSFGTNIGGGLKVSLAGPIRLRLDYRVFSLGGTPRVKTPQRFYAGLNIAF